VTRNGLRLTLFLLLVVFVGVAGWQYYGLELDSARSAEEARQLDGFRDAVHHAVSEARTAQQAYLADGQGVDYWGTRFAEAIADITGALENLRVTAGDDETTIAALDRADRALKVYDGLDRKIRGFVESGSLLMAADVVYEDGMKTSGLILEAVDEAHRALASPQQAAIESNTLLRRWLAMAVAAAGVLVSLLLLPSGRPVSASVARDEAATRSTLIDDENDWRLDRPARAEAPAPQPPAPAAEAPPPPAQAAPAATPVPASPPREAASAAHDAAALAAAAQVCTDLARVQDGDQLRDVLGRAARVLDATGVIVWIVDAEGRALKPLLTYGYPEEALRRIPTLPRDADNATAAAWRDGVTHVVEATDAAPGAVAVPILGPQGCTGVLAAEIGHHREAARSTRAVAQLVAAQLAVLIPPDTAGSTET
jgi:CHASE3 domain sensor protein